MRPLRVHALQASSPQPDTARVGDTVSLAVRAVDERGIGVAGVEITWRATEAGDVITPAVDTTDAGGLSSATLRLSQVSGMHGALATTRDFISRSLFVEVLSAGLLRIELQPKQLDLVARQTAVVAAMPIDSSGNPLSVPLRWGSNNAAVATVDSNGVVLARRAGSAIIYVNATVPPFRVDSLRVNVRAAIPARLVVRPHPEKLIQADLKRFTAMAFDSSGKFIDAENIVWTVSPGIQNWFGERFADSTVIYLRPSALGPATVEARIAQLSVTISGEVIADPLVERAEMVTPSFCYGGVTIGPSGQWYYISNVGGSRLPADTIAVVRTGRSGLSSWSTSEPFVECDRRFQARPHPTISVDADENLYVPTQYGVLSISGITGAKRWDARIGRTFGNIAIAQDVVLVGRETEVVALDKRDGAVVWRTTWPASYFGGRPAVIDEARGVAYVTGGGDIDALDLRTGAARWRLNVNFPGAPPLLAMANTGDLYVGGPGVVHRVTPAGAISASHTVIGTVVGSPLIDAQGRVFVATTAGWLYSFTPDLTLVWQLELVPFAYYYTSGEDAPVIDRDGTVYFGFRGEMHAVRDGKLLWSRWDLSTGWAYLWTLGADGFLYATNHAQVPRVRTGGLDPQAQWPMTHRTPARSAAR